jgi:GAF domain-containing protein
MPLEVRGEVVAELDLWSEGEALSIQEKNLLDEIRSHVSQAIESSQLFEETQVRVKRERILNQFAANLSKSFDLDALLQQAVRELAQMPNVNEVAILIKPPTTQEPVTQVSRKTAPVGSDGKESSMEGLS